MIHLVAPIPPPPRLLEPVMVTALRQQLRRGAAPSVLHRIAGGEGEFRRLASAYNLGPAPRSLISRAPTAGERGPSAKPTAAHRRAVLFAFIKDTARARLVFPMTAELAERFGWYERLVLVDLRALVRGGSIRVATFWVEHLQVRRVWVLGTDLATVRPT